MLTIEQLKEFGANTAEGLERCMNNEAFYLRLVGMAAADANFERLPEAIASGDLGGALEAAHALKGVLANLSLTPILTPAVEITEMLRGRQQADYAPLLEEIRAQREALQALIAE